MLESFETCFEVYEFEFKLQGCGESFEDAAASWDDLFANSIAGNEA